MKEHVMLASFNGNPNVGLYGVVTDKHVLLGKEVPHAHDKQLEKVLGKPIERVTIAGTSLVGVFCVWTGKKLLVPGIIFDDELEVLRALGIDAVVITTKLTCLGNNILPGTKRALLNPDFKEHERKAIEEALELPCEAATIMEVEAIGALGIARGRQALFHRDIPPQEVKRLGKDLGLDITQGTVNMGNPYIKSGILLSEEGFVIGDASGGPEITNADEAFGFVG